MKYNVDDRVVIMQCPNARYIGVTGTVVLARPDGTYNVEPDEKFSKDLKPCDRLSTVLMYGAELNRV